jgi:hypothetical protein
MDSLDRKTLRRLWKEDERLFGGRSKDDLAFHTRNGFGALTAEKEDSELLPALAGLELKRRVHHLSFWLKQLISI